MIWAIDISKYTDILELTHIHHVTLLDDNNLEVRQIPKDAIIKGLRMGMQIENIYEEYGEIKQKAFEKYNETSLKLNFNNPERDIKRFALRPYTNSTAICYDVEQKKLVCSQVKNKNNEMQKYFSICRPSESKLVLEYESQLRTGLAKKIMVKQDIIGGDLNIINDGDEVIFVGGLNGPIDDYKRDLQIPKGVTTVAGGAITYAKSVTFPDTVNKFLEGRGLMCGRIYNLPTNIKWDADGVKCCQLRGRLSDSEDENTPIVVPKVNDWKPTVGYLRGITNNKIIYAEEEENRIYQDALFAGSYEVKAVALMGKGKIGIGKSQFKGITYLRSVLTPNGKIVAIDKDGFSGCTRLENIDLTECQYIGRNGLYRVYSDEELKTLSLRFEKSIKLESGSLGGNIRNIMFYGDDIELVGSVFIDYGDVEIGYRTTRVRDKLKKYIYDNEYYRYDGKIRIYKL